MEDVITDRNITASLLTNGDGKIATISKKYKFEIAYDAKKRHLKKPILSTLDIIISVFIVGPCVVGFWRGTWQLMDFHARFFPPWESFFFGVFIHVGFIMFQDTFQEIFVKHQGMTFFPKALHFVCLRIYTYFFAVVCNMHWRGGWALFDHYLKVQFNDYGVTLKKGSCTFIMVFVGCFLMILLLKSLINCIAPPFCISLDKSRNTFTIRTRFKAKMDEKASLYILDCIFSVLIIGTLVVFVWRGAWSLIDIFLFPEDDIWSAWGSLILGYSVVGIAFLLQPFMKWLCDRITGAWRLIAADIFLIFSLIGTVNVWRGIWNLLNIYLLPDQLELSCWITHWFCLIVLMLLGCSNSLLVRGVYIDAEEPAGKCVIFPCYYLRVIFQEQKLKKLQNEQQQQNTKTEMITVNNHTEINHYKEEIQTA